MCRCIPTSGLHISTIIFLVYHCFCNFLSVAFSCYRFSLSVVFSFVYTLSFCLYCKRYFDHFAFGFRVS